MFENVYKGLENIWRMCKVCKCSKTKNETVAAHESTNILNQVVVLPRFVKTVKLCVM